MPRTLRLVVVKKSIVKEEFNGLFDNVRGC